MNEAARIGILGGTLDPIHMGHIEAALAAREALRLDRILVIPAHVPPHRARPITSPFHRFAMAAIAVNGLDGFVVSEMELTAEGPSYSADTLMRLHVEQGLAASQIFFITGADAFAEIDTWSRYPAVLDLANFVVVARPGTTLQAMRQRLPGLKERMRISGDFRLRPDVRKPDVRKPDFQKPDFRKPEATLGDQPLTLIYLVDAPTPDVSSTDIRQRIMDGRSIAGLVPPGVEHHIQQHALYLRQSVTSSTADHLHGQD